MSASWFSSPNNSAAVVTPGDAAVPPSLFLYQSTSPAYPLPPVPAPLAAALAWAGAHKTAVELVLTALLYTPLLLYSAWRVFTKPYKMHYRRRHPVVVVHNFVAVAELVHYYARLAALGRPPAPTPLETALAVVQIASSMVLNAGLGKDLSGSRATFHVAGMQRLFAVVMAAHFGDAAWNRASIKILDSFFGLRLMFALNPYLAGVTSWRDIYRFGMILCHAMCLWVVDYPFGLPVLVVGHLVLLAVNKSVTQRVESGR
jgi:hypothetical protein